eukprot:scaffold30179_cov71-Skeletonema_marinoi.AAC.1
MVGPGRMSCPPDSFPYGCYKQYRLASSCRKLATFLRKQNLPPLKLAFMSAHACILPSPFLLHGARPSQKGRLVTGA